MNIISEWISLDFYFFIVIIPNCNWDRSGNIFCCALFLVSYSSLLLWILNRSIFVFVPAYGRSGSSVVVLGPWLLSTDYRVSHHQHGNIIQRGELVRPDYAALSMIYLAISTWYIAWDLKFDAGTEVFPIFSPASTAASAWQSRSLTWAQYVVMLAAQQFDCRHNDKGGKILEHLNFKGININDM